MTERAGEGRPGRASATDAEPPAGSQPPPGRGRLRWAAALGAVLLALAAAEIATRLAFPRDWDAATIAADQAQQKFWVHRALSDDLELYYVLRPDIETHFGGVPVRVDAHGRRVPDAPLPDEARPPGEPVRLALVGDSSAFGWKVTWADTYGEQVREQLQAAWKRPVDLINYAVPGYNAEQETRLLETDVLPAHPDLILWHYDHNDADAILNFNEPLDLPPTWGDNPLHSALIKALRRKLELRRVAARVLETEPHPRLGGYISSGPLYERHLDALDRAAMLAERAGVPMLVIVFDADCHPPGEDNGHYEILHKPLLARLAALPVTVLDLYPPEQAELAARGWSDLSAWWQAPDDHHPVPEEHAFIAAQVAAKVLATPALTPR